MTNSDISNRPRIKHARRQQEILMTGAMRENARLWKNENTSTLSFASVFPMALILRGYFWIFLTKWTLKELLMCTKRRRVVSFMQKVWVLHANSKFQLNQSLRQYQTFKWRWRCRNVFENVKRTQTLSCCYSHTMLWWRYSRSMGDQPLLAEIENPLFEKPLLQLHTPIWYWVHFIAIHKFLKRS